MSKWVVEMTYIVGVSLEDIEANTQDEAIEKAKKMVEENAHWHMNVDEAQFDQVTYVDEE